MADVVGIDGRKTTKSLEPRAEVVSLLKDLLARAEDGSLRQIAVVFIDQTGRAMDGYAPGAAPDEMIPIIGGLELCKATLLSQMIGVGV